MFWREHWKIDNLFSFNGKRLNKIGEKLAKNIAYILQFTDSARFMASSLSNLLNNFSQRTDRIKCNFGHDNKKYETCRIKY